MRDIPCVHARNRSWTEQKLTSLNNSFNWPILSSKCFGTISSIVDTAETRLGSALSSAIASFYLYNFYFHLRAANVLLSSIFSCSFFFALTCCFILWLFWLKSFLNVILIINIIILINFSLQIFCKKYVQYLV